MEENTIYIEDDAILDISPDLEDERDGIIDQLEAEILGYA